MELELKVGMGIGWEHPQMQEGEVLIGTVAAIDLVARTVDLEFPDGSARGKIPWEQLGRQRRSEFSPAIDVIGPRGIDSEERMGRF